jgi:hypothetical protein
MFDARVRDWGWGNWISGEIGMVGRLDWMGKVDWMGKGDIHSLFRLWHNYY